MKFPALRASSDKLIGIAAMELTIRFVLWMQAQPAIPTRQQIAAHFGVHKSTAWRWRSHWLAATGQHDPLARDDQSGGNRHHSIQGSKQ